MRRLSRVAAVALPGVLAAAAGAFAQQPAPPLRDPILPGPLPLPELPSGAPCVASRQVVVFAGGLDLGPLDGGERGGIAIVRPDGTGLRKITNFTTTGLTFNRVHGLNMPDDHPALAPDGRRIAFASKRLGDHDIFTMRPDGTDVRRISAAPGLDTQPQFSPDGTRIAFATERFGGGLDIAVMNADGTGVRRLTSSPAEEIEPAWSPGGGRIAFTRATGPNDKEVFTIAPDGTAERQVTFVPDREDHDATFEPGGSSLLITSERAPTSPPFGNVHRVDVNFGLGVGAGDAIDDADGDLTDDLVLGAGDPAVSCDGGRIAFFKAKLPTLGPMELFTMRRDGTGKRHIPVEGQLAVHPGFGPATDSDGDGTPDYLESAPVGTARVRGDRVLRAGRTERLVIDWTHPARRWRALDTLRFHLVGARGRPAGIVRVTENDRAFSLYEPARRAWTRRTPLSRGGRLRAGAVTLDLARTRIAGAGRRTVRLVLALRLAARAEGRLRLRAEATGDPARARAAGDHEPLKTIARLRVITRNPSRRSP
jgi:WD40-like Beta Propeller Repeat